MNLNLDSWRLDLSLGHHETDEEDEEHSYFVPDFRQTSEVTLPSMPKTLSKLAELTTKPEDHAVALNQLRCELLEKKLIYTMLEMFTRVMKDAIQEAEYGVPSESVKGE